MSFDALFEKLLGKEGGYSNDPNDAGGETNWGITKTTARAYGYTGAMKDMTQEQAKAIYKEEYWTQAGCEEISKVSERVADELFDTGVNMGPRIAGKYLQRALNVLTDDKLIMDGQIGAGTVATLAKYIKKRGKEGEEVLIRALDCLQGMHYIELTETRQQNKKFIYGWLRTRIENA